MADNEVNGAAIDAALADGSGGPMVLRLRKPVIAHGDEVSELKFREPTGADIERCGSPINMDFLGGEVPKMSFEPKAMTAMMATLAQVPPSTIRQLHPRDWTNGAWQLALFFMPDPG